MKIKEKITHTDGTVIEREIEGDADELSQYEQVPEEQNETRQKKRDVLLGKEVEDLKRLFDQLQAECRAKHVSPTWIWFTNGIGCIHDFPNPWFGIGPAACKKCGQLAWPLSPTYQWSGEVKVTSGVTINPDCNLAAGYNGSVVLNTEN